MAISENTVLKSFEASSDLSTKQFYIVKMTAGGNNRVELAGDGVLPIGVLYDDPSAVGRDCAVAVGGTAKVVSDGTVAAGEVVSSTAAGKATQAASGDWILGVCTRGGAADGDIIEVEINISHFK